MSSVARNDNVRLFTLTEVLEVNGEPGNFTVKLKQNPRYIDPDKCTGCQKCMEECPVEVTSEYDMNLGVRKAIYLPFPQAVPQIPRLDKENCIDCGMCELVCPADAVNHEDFEKIFEIEVGSIIVATGFDEFNPEPLKQFGYGYYENVVTSLQFERMMHPTGPTQGKIVRPSDGKEPRRVLWVQCVGSRSEKEVGNKFCNRVCCMFALKQARAYKLQSKGKGQADLCYIDIRSSGKLYEEYYRDTRNNYMPNLIRGKVAEIQENEETKDLIIWVEDTNTGEVSQIKDVDLVVLSSSFVPSEGTNELCQTLSVEISDDGFPLEVNSYHPIETTRPGIFMAGVATGSKDAVDTVTQARAAASSAVNLLSGSPPYIKSYASKTELEGSGEIRLGVFVCHCGGNIANYIDITEVMEYAKTLPGVIYVDNNEFFCSEPGQQQISEKIKELNINRVLVAACSPLLHEDTFRTLLESAGISKYYLEYVNIRDQAAQVHMQTPKEATEKAKDLIRAGIARALHLEIVPYRMVSVVNEALVIGGGIAGMSATLDLSNQGFNVHLVEKELQLGGRLNSLYRVFPEKTEASQIVDELTAQITNAPNISVYLESSLESLDGHIGDFTAKIRRNNGANTDINVGAIIVAVGTNTYTPKDGEYGYNTVPRVVTSLEFEELLKTRNFDQDPKRIVFIQCVGSREEDGNKYCSRVCCGVSLKNAQNVRELFPNCQTFVLFKEDLRPVGRYMEEFYLTTRKQYRTNFMRWTEERPPMVTEAQNGNALVQIYDTLLRTTFEIDADYVVLAVGQEPPEGFDELCKIIGVTRSSDGFLEPIHIKFKPVETRKDGVYVAGTILSPRSISDSIVLGKAAASAASVLLQQKEIQLELIKAVCDENLCSGCKVCVIACPYDAITTKETEAGELVSVTDEIECKGCGSCIVACPSGARELRYWRDEQFYPQIESLLAESKQKSLLLVFACEKCGYGAADLAGLSKLQYDYRTRIIRVPCTGRVDTPWLLKAFSLGADGVAVVG